MSKYIRIYEALCPYDSIADDDSRRPAILAEMRSVCRAKTPRDAALVISWWRVRPNTQHLTPLEFVKEARKLCAKMK